MDYFNGARSQTHRKSATIFPFPAPQGRVGLHAIRFRRFKEAVDTNFFRWHQVCDYARALDSSEKTLARATLSIAGMSAKRFIVDRISLEAKRLLAYTGLPISEISSRLGFDEATNFVKFFRRETGSTPGIFRRELR
ncbi:helix-turn-helix domain-containing protein [Rhizobium leguminosarum]|uniref:helix-turn-helix domain-containing protein n=1 Tax=Rhizobium leguminosarum TaxID=384 RepID=UPI003F9E3DE3